MVTGYRELAIQPEAGSDLEDIVNEEHVWDTNDVPVHINVDSVNARDDSNTTDRHDDTYIVDGFDSEKLKVGIDWMGNEVDSRNLDIDKIRQKAQSFDSNKIASEYIDLYLRILKT